MLLVIFFMVSTLFIPQSAFSHDYEVLFPYTLGKDALEYQSAANFDSEFRTFLADGEVESVGTESTTYDRSLISHIRLLSNFPVVDRLALRVVMSAAATVRKVEGAEQPRIIKEESYYDLKPRVELTFTTQNALEVFVGINYRLVGSYDSVTESIDLVTTERFGSASMNYPHFGFVKRAGAFSGGFYFQQGAEKARSVSKSNDRESIIISIEDRIQDPTTLGIFAKSKVGKFDVFAEFSAIQAGEGGNKTDDGASVEEDYIRLHFSALMPTPFVDLKGTFIYKSLSYADSRNVSLRTIPQMGIHLESILELGGLELNAGIVGGYGTDGQSIDEFNANYKIISFGGSAGVKISF